MGVQIQKFELTAEDKSAQAFESMKARVRELVGAVGGLDGAFKVLAGGLSVSIFAGLIKESIETMDALHRMSIATGVTVETLSAMRTSAKQSETSMESVAKGTQILAKNMLDTAHGTGKAASTFAELGISVLDSSGHLKSSDSIMLELAKTLTGMENKTQAVAYAQKLMGKAGAELLPFLQKLAENGLENSKVTTQQAEEAHKFEQALLKMQTASKAWFMHLASELLPTLEKLLDLIKRLALPMAAAFGVFVVAPALIAPVVAAFTTLGAAVSLAAEVFAAGKIAQGFAALNTMLYGTSVAATVATGVLGTLTVAFGLLFAAVVGFKIGEWLSENFVEARMVGIAFIDAMMKGWEYLKYAGQMAWLGIKTVFLEVIGFIQNAYAAMLEKIAKGASYLPGMSGISNFIGEVAASLRSAADHTGEFTAEQAKLKKTLDTNVAGIDAITTAMSQDAMEQMSATVEVKKHTNAVDIHTKAMDDAAKAYQRLLDQSSNYLDQLEKETRQINLSTLEKKADDMATLALGLKEKDRIAFLSRGYKDLQAWVDAETQLAEIKSSKEILDADQKALDLAIKQNEEFGKSASQISAMTLAKNEATFATMRLGEATQLQIDTMRRSIDLGRQILEQNSMLDSKKAIDATNKAIEAEAKRTVNSIDSTVHQGFDRMFDKLGGGWEAFLKSMVGSFKRLVADQLYTFFARPIVLQIIAGTASTLGLSTVASAATSAAGLSSSLGMGSNILGGFGSALAGGILPGATSIGEAASGLWATGTAASAMAGGGASGLLAGGGAALGAMGPVGWGALALGALGASGALGDLFGGGDGGGPFVSGAVTRPAPAGFDATAYMAANPDVAASSTYAGHPYDHYVEWGQGEGRKLMPDDWATNALNPVVQAQKALEVSFAAMRDTIEQARDPLAYWTKQTASLGTDLGSSATTVEQWRKQFLIAMDGTLTQDQFTKWQQFGTAIQNATDELARAGTVAADVFDTLSLSGKMSLLQKQLTAAVNDQIKSSQDGIKTATQAADAYRKLSASLADSVSQLRGGSLSTLLPAQQLAESRGILDDTFRKAISGDTAAIGNLDKVATDFLNASRTYNASSTAYADDFSRVMDMLAQAQTASLNDASVMDYQAQLLNMQVTALTAIQDELSKPSPDAGILNDQKALLDSIGGLLSNQSQQLITTNSTLFDQKGELIVGHAIVSAQTGQIVAVASAIDAQTRQTITGNMLVDLQTQQIMLGNGTQAAIRDVLAMNASLSQAQRDALLAGAVADVNGFSSLLGQGSVTISLLQQIVNLTAQQQAADAVGVQQQAGQAYNAAQEASNNARTNLEAYIGSLGGSSVINVENVQSGLKANYGFQYTDQSQLDQVNALDASYANAFYKAVGLYSVLPGHASGLDYVPYDDYLMRAHRGEAVLTSSDASDWRSGRGGISGGDLSALTTTMREVPIAVKQGSQDTTAAVRTGLEALREDFQSLRQELRRVVSKA